MEKESDEGAQRKRAEEAKRLDGYWCPERDDREEKPVGVLLSDEIEYYVSRCRMIDPFIPERLCAASYELTVGDEYSLGGEMLKLSEGEEIKIDAFQVAIIKTQETLNLPRFIIARWNIRVRWAYKGLLWVGGPQVDPGWVGHLCCPIYNLSDKAVTLRFGDPLARMDFVSTTPFNDKSAKHVYPRPPKRILFEDYNPGALKSALYTEARKRIDKIEEATEKKVGRLEALVINYMIASITIIAIFIAIVAFFTVPEKKTIPLWIFVNVWLSGASLLLLGLIYWAVKSQAKRKLGEDFDRGRQVHTTDTKK